MSLLTFAKTALGSLAKEPVTVAYPAQEQQAPARLRGHVVNDMNVCICCGMCAKRCPAAALVVDRKAGTWSIDPYACVSCGECVSACPKKCLSMDTGRSSVTVKKTCTVQTMPADAKPAKPKVDPEKLAAAKAKAAAIKAAKAAEAARATAETEA